MTAGMRSQFARSRHPPLRAAAARFLYAPGASNRLGLLHLATAKPAVTVAAPALSSGEASPMRVLLANCQQLFGGPGAFPSRDRQ